VDPDLGGPKTCGSGSATQLFSILVVIFALVDPDTAIELMRFHADPDPKPWYNRKELTKIASGFCLDEVLDSVHLYTAENVGRTQLPHQVAAKLPRVLSRATLRKKYSYLPNSKVN
jgi:hypothetical protein